MNEGYAIFFFLVLAIYGLILGVSFIMDMFSGKK